MTDTVSASFTIHNARVFDGQNLSKPRSVSVEHGLIAAEATSDVVVDAEGRVLLPGFIDAHVQLESPSDAYEFARWGITTALDLGTPSAALIADMRTISGVDDADRFVADRVADGCECIEIVIDRPGTTTLTGAAIAALVVAAHKVGLLTIAQARTTASVQLAIDAWVDVLAHAPLDAPLSETHVAQIVAKGMSIIPTLVMMRGVSEKMGMLTQGPGPGLHNALSAVAALDAAGVNIIAGTGVNSTSSGAFSPVRGHSFHDELELLVAAGLSPAQALQSATVNARGLFGLRDRAIIALGKRADLVLIDGDPLADIAATRGIHSVWVAGIRVAL